MRYPVFLNRYRWFGKARRGCETAPAPISRKARAQWPGRNRKPPLRFCAPEVFRPAQGVTPANGVRGKATMSTKCSSGAVPGGKIPSAHNKRNPKPVPSSVTASPCHLPPRGKAYGRPHGAAPTKFKGTSGFAVGADDLGGPRAHTVRPYRPIGMFQGGRVRAPAPTAYPKVRLSFVGPDAPIGPFPCGPVCRPYEINANIRRGPRPARFACVLFGMTFTECQ